MPHSSPGLSISNYFRLIPVDLTVPFFPALSSFVLSLIFPPYISPMLSLLYLSTRLIPVLLLQSFCLIFNLTLSISNYSRLIFVTFYPCFIFAADLSRYFPPYVSTLYVCIIFHFALYISNYSHLISFLLALYFPFSNCFIFSPDLFLFFSPYPCFYRFIPLHSLSPFSPYS